MLLYHKKEGKSIDKRQKLTECNISWYNIIQSFYRHNLQIVCWKIYSLYLANFFCQPFLCLQHLNFSPVRGLEKLSVLCYNGNSKKSTSGWSLRLAWGGVRSIGFKVWPQSWPFTASDYVGIMDFAARKSTGFGRKSTKKHAKWGKKPMSCGLGRRCRRFESCHSDHIECS